MVLNIFCTESNQKILIWYKERKKDYKVSDFCITGAPELVNEGGQKRSTPTYKPNHSAEFHQTWCEDTLGEYYKGYRGDF